MTESNQTMGKRIMNLRKQAGMTQEQLADRLGVSPQAVSKWENDVSCPDISTLPKLAEIFGVTTDVLLGVQPSAAEQDDAANATETENTTNGSRAEVVFDIGDNTYKKSFSLKGIGFAVLLIAIGAAYLISNTVGVNLPFDLWSIVWPAALLGLGIAMGLKERSPFLFGVAFIGLYYLLAALGSPLPFPLTWSVIWPLGLVLLGLSIITEKLFPKKSDKHGFSMHTTSYSYTEENGFVNCDLSFGSESIVVAAPKVYGGSIDVSFGECTVDFTRCTSFETNARIDLDVSFGTCKIILPATVRAISTAGSSFGAIEIKGEPIQSATPLYIDGDISFGSAEIQYR